MKIALHLDRLDQVCTCAVTRKTCDRNVRTRKKLGDLLVLSEQQYGGDRRKEFISIADREQKVLPQKIACLVKIQIRSIFVKAARKTPNECVVKVRFLHILQRNILKAERPQFIEPRREFRTRNLAFLGAEAKIESSVARSIRPFAAVDIKSDDTLSAVERDRVKNGNDRRHDLLAADTRKFFLNPFGIADAFDPKLVVDAEDDRSAVCIRDGDDALRYSLAVRKFYFELEIRVLAAADQSQQFGSGCRWRILIDEIFLKGMISC